MTANMPLARKQGLIVQKVNEELLLNDLDTHHALCLNQTAALAWKYCDGQTTVPQIAAKMAEELNRPIDQKYVWYALDKLGKNNLLQQPVMVPLTFTLTRREFLGKAGIIGAGVAIPVILSIVAPTPVEAQTTAPGCILDQNRPDGCPCTNNGQCIQPSHKCAGGVCAAPTPRP